MRYARAMSLDDILDGQADAIDALFDSHVPAWQTLLEHLAEHRPEAASPAFVTALLERSGEPQIWVERARAAAADIDSEWFTTVRAASRLFERWLAEGMRRSMPHDSPPMLAVRYLEAVDRVDPYSLAAARSLVDDVGRVLPQSTLLADTLLLVAERADEAGDFATTVDAVTLAEQVLASLGDTGRANLAMRRRGAAFLRAGKLDEAFPILDRCMRTRAAPWVGGATLLAAADDVRQRALDEAATIAMWSDGATAEWARALGGLAEQLRHPEAERRFGLALQSLAGSANGISDLGVVVRQASERGLVQTARAASDWIERLRPRSPTQE